MTLVPIPLNFAQAVPRDIRSTFARPHGVVLRMLFAMRGFPPPRRLYDDIGRLQIQPFGVILTTERTQP